MTIANFNIWIIFGVVAAILLIVFWRSRNAVWGGLIIGTIIGFMIALFDFKENGFVWYIVGKGAILGTILGFIADLLGRMSDFIKK